MASVTDYCSWWPEYINNIYIGGCCAIHDATTKGWFDFGSHKALAQCVADTGAGSFWGNTMYVGIALGGGVFAAW